MSKPDLIDAASKTLALCAVALELFVLVTLLLAIASLFSQHARVWLRGLRGLFSGMELWLAFTVALVAFLGSLFFSEYADFIPCRLCWFQRIAMYPLPLLLGIATLRRDRAIRVYAIPMALVGAAISIYHYQLERFPSQTHLSCELDSPCTTVWFWKFHYISLPLMALSGFLLIVWLTWIAGQSERP